jgi:hypothetical protein
MSRARKDLNTDPDPDLAAELRQGAGREWAEEAAEDERLTELLRRRKLELADVAKDLAHRGGKVSVEFGGHSFSGTVIGAGVDYATIDSPGETAAIRFDVARWSIIPASRADESRMDRSESFKALLHEYAAAETTLRLAIPYGEMVFGTIAVVSVDHIEVADVDGRQIYIPSVLVLAAIRSTELH